MKISKEVKEVNVGMTLNMSNVELLVLATEAEKIIESCPMLRTALEVGKDPIHKDSTSRVDNKSLLNVLKFVRKLTYDTISLDKAFANVFLEDKERIAFTDQHVSDLVEVSTVGKIILSESKLDNQSV